MAGCVVGAAPIFGAGLITAGALFIVRGARRGSPNYSGSSNGATRHDALAGLLGELTAHLRALAQGARPPVR